MPRFVVQEHCARSHHFDLCWEKDGVLVSWAVSKFESRESRVESRKGRTNSFDSRLTTLDSRRVGDNWLVHEIEPEGG